MGPRVNMDQESKWAKDQDGLLLFTPERVELTVNTKKERMAGSKRSKSQDGLLWLKSAVKTIESNWAKRSQVGPGPF